MFYFIIGIFTDDDMCIIGSCELFERSSDIYCLTDDSGFHAFLSTDSSEGDSSSIDPDTDMDLFSDGALLEGLDIILDFDRCRDTRISIFPIKDSEDTISEIFIDISAIFTDTFSYTMEIDI